MRGTLAGIAKWPNYNEARARFSFHKSGDEALRAAMAAQIANV